MKLTFILLCCCFYLYSSICPSNIKFLCDYYEDYNSKNNKDFEILYKNISVYHKKEKCSGIVDCIKKIRNQRNTYYNFIIKFPILLRVNPSLLINYGNHCQNNPKEEEKNFCAPHVTKDSYYKAYFYSKEDSDKNNAENLYNASLDDVISERNKYFAIVDELNKSSKNKYLKYLNNYNTFAVVLRTSEINKENFDTFNQHIKEMEEVIKNKEYSIYGAYYRVFCGRARTKKFKNPQVIWLSGFFIVRRNALMFVGIRG
jgi:hypothetical protein